MVLDLAEESAVAYAPQRDLRFESSSRPNDFPGRPFLGDSEMVKKAGLRLEHIESFLEIAPFFQEDNFDNVKINASKRRNIPLLNSLLTSQGFLETIYKLVPDNLIRRGRTLFDKLSVSGSTDNDSGTGTLSDSEFHALEQKLESDIFYYKQLFAPGPIQSGSGMVSL